MTTPTTTAPQPPQSGLVERCLATFTDGLQHADNLTLDHEAERVEAMQPSPLVVSMRKAVDNARETFVVRRAALLLDELTKADSIAAKLGSLDVRGRRGKCAACPIAVYLLHNVPGLEDISVGDIEATLHFRHDGVMHVETIDLPEAVTGFIIAFDLGQCPALEVSA